VETVAFSSVSSKVCLGRKEIQQGVTESLQGILTSGEGGHRVTQLLLP
jgi:hypothetical protein